MESEQPDFERVGRVVFVDDEQDVLDSIVRDLSDWIDERELEVVAVTSAREALEFIAEDYPRTGLVVSDLRMPGMSGADLFVAISERYPEVGLVMVTAYSDMEAITRAVASSMLGLIQKPWDPDRLADELGRAIDLVERGRAMIRQQHEIGLLERRADRFRASYLHMRRPTDPRVEVTSLSRPGAERVVTQDFFAIRRLAGGEHLAYIGEADQDPFTATLLTATVRIQLEEWRGPADPSEFLGMLVQRLSEHALIDETPPISISVAVLDPPELTLACAGEPRACVVSDEGVSWPKTFGRAIQQDDQMVAAGETLAVHPGDRVVLFSDGILDRPERTNGNPPGVRMEPVFRRAHRSPDFEDTVVRLITADRILRNSSTVPLFRDDATLISLKLTGERA